MPSTGQRRTHARTNRRTTRKHAPASSTGRAAVQKLNILSRSYELSSESTTEPSITRYHIRCHQHLNRVATLPGETPGASSTNTGQWSEVFCTNQQLKRTYEHTISTRRFLTRPDKSRATHTHRPVEQPFVRDYPGEPVPER